jgi:hypothetical protein
MSYSSNLLRSVFFSHFALLATLREYVVKYHAKTRRTLSTKYNINFCQLLNKN